MKPRDKFALAGQAICHYELGQKDAAKQTWHSLIKIDPDYIGIEVLVKDYRPVQRFVETASQLIVELVTGKGEK